MKSRSATNEAALAVLVEQRNKAQLAIQRAQTIIDSLVVKATFDGVVAAKENRDAAGGSSSARRCRNTGRATRPSPGRAIADVIETGKMEVRAKINETDRDNLQTGQVATVRIGRAAGPDLHREGRRAQRPGLARQLVRDLAPSASST